MKSIAIAALATLALAGVAQAQTSCSYDVFGNYNCYKAPSYNNNSTNPWAGSSSTTTTDSWGNTTTYGTTNNGSTYQQKCYKNSWGSVTCY